MTKDRVKHKIIIDIVCFMLFFTAFLMLAWIKYTNLHFYILEEEIYQKTYDCLISIIRRVTPTDSALTIKNIGQVAYFMYNSITVILIPAIILNIDKGNEFKVIITFTPYILFFLFLETTTSCYEKPIDIFICTFNMFMTTILFVIISYFFILPFFYKPNKKS